MFNVSTTSDFKVAEDFDVTLLLYFILDVNNIMNFYDERTKELKQIEIIKTRVNQLSKENTKLKQQLNNLKSIINYG